MKKTFFYTLILMTTLLYSCSKKKVEVPSDILSTEKMIDVLTDVEIAEAAVLQHVTRMDSASVVDTVSDYKSAYYKFVFEKNKVKPDDFQRSMDWYAAHPEFQKKIYEEVVNDLSKKQSEVAN